MKTAGFVILMAIADLSCQKNSDCPCRALETCIDHECVLQDNCYYINNQGIRGHNLYHGIAHSNACVDTLALDIQTSDTTHLFSLYANVRPWGLYCIPLHLEKIIHGDEFVLACGTTICRRPNGKEWYPAYVRCKLLETSVSMEIKFKQWFDLSGRYVDSCSLTLVR